MAFPQIPLTVGHFELDPNLQKKGHLRVFEDDVLHSGWKKRWVSVLTHTYIKNICLAESINSSRKVVLSGGSLFIFESKSRGEVCDVIPSGTTISVKMGNTLFTVLLSNCRKGRRTCWGGSERNRNASNEKSVAVVFVVFVG